MKPRITTVALLSTVTLLIQIGLSACSSDKGSDADSSTGGTPATGGTPETGGSAGSGTGGGTDLGGANAGSGGAPMQPCSLEESGPVTSSAVGQTIENLHITSTTGDGLAIEHDNVTVRNVWVEHEGGRGIYIKADGVSLKDIHVSYTGAPESGENSTSAHTNIECYQGANLDVERARLDQGSSGIYLQSCADSHLQWIEGHDFRGPFPRGQVVQWNASDRGVLEDFSVVNPPGSWPEDNVNVYKSYDAVIRRGLIDGNNAPNGVGVIFDGGDSTGLVEDVDAVRMGNGCFSGYAGGEDVTFRRTRCRSNICESQDGRGEPSSNALMWAGQPGRTELRIFDSTYFDSCNGNVLWPVDSFAVAELVEEDYVQRAPVELSFCWQ